MRYWPVPSVTAVRVFSIRTGLAVSTVTPGRTAPDASFTTPVIDACAYADAGSMASKTGTNSALLHGFILSPPVCRDGRVSIVASRGPGADRTTQGLS